MVTPNDVSKYCVKERELN